MAPARLATAQVRTCCGYLSGFLQIGSRKPSGGEGDGLSYQNGVSSLTNTSYADQIKLFGLPESATSEQRQLTRGLSVNPAGGAQAQLRKRSSSGMCVSNSESDFNHQLRFVTMSEVIVCLALVVGSPMARTVPLFRLQQTSSKVLGEKNTLIVRLHFCS